MKFITNDVQTYTPKTSSDDYEDGDVSEEKRSYLSYGKEFGSFDEALAAAKRAAYHCNQKQVIKLVVAEINPVIERLETDFAVDPAVFNTEK